MNSRTILRNSAWYGLENLISYASSLITSIVIARALGPSKMGYLVYVTWIVTITCSLGSVGIPATTRKYMSEFLGRGDRGTARLIYQRTLLIQFVVASIATLGAVVWVLHDAPAEYRAGALLLVLSTLPAMTNFVSAQANVASEDLADNLPASASSVVVYFVMAMLAVVLHWGVTGIALATFLMRFSDFAIRLVPTFRRITRWDVGTGQLPTDLNQRMRRFAAQSVMGMLLTLIVWDRSEILLLKHLSPDIRQLAFYSVALGLADRLLIFPSIFAGATGASILAQYGRDPSRLPAMTAASLRYLVLSSVPVHLIATALVGPALLAVYGHQYAGALVVATASPLLCLPKAFLGPIQSLFESTDEQRFFLYSTVGASFVDLGIAWALIPHYGALGACIGSGVAQGAAVSTMWLIGIRAYGIRLPWTFFAKLTALSAGSAGLAYLAAFRLPALPGVLLGGVVSIVSFVALAAVFRLLEQEDISRVRGVIAMAPQRFAGPLERVLLVMGRRTPQNSAVVS